ASARCAPRLPGALPICWQTAVVADPFAPDTIVASACPDGVYACDGTPMGPYQDLVPVPGGFAATLTLGSADGSGHGREDVWWVRSEEHTSELQSRSGVV